MPSDFCSTVRVEQWHGIIGSLYADKVRQPGHAHCFPLLSAARATSRYNLHSIQPAAEYCEVLLKLAVFQK